MRLPLRDSDLSQEGVLVCKWHQSCFDVLTDDIKAWCPGLDPDSTTKNVELKIVGNIS